LRELKADADASRSRIRGWEKNGRDGISGKCPKQRRLAPVELVAQIGTIRSKGLFENNPSKRPEADIDVKYDASLQTVGTLDDRKSFLFIGRIRCSASSPVLSQNFYVETGGLEASCCS